jgi:KamA family protein
MEPEDYTPKYIRLPHPIRSIKQAKHAGIVGLEGIGPANETRRIRFPFFTNKYYLSLINPHDKEDPIRQLIIPSTEEISAYNDITTAGSYDTSGEHTNFKAPGLQHKYEPTALALVSNACATHCRECFRKRQFLEGEKNTEGLFPNPAALNYLKRHKEINSILLSGGDSFMLTDESIENILDMLDVPELEHIKTIRFGTKMHAFYPMRITDELCQMLQEYSDDSEKSIHICTHFDHPREISPQAKEALDMMAYFGLHSYNQTVFLRGINDDAETLNQLWNALTSHGVRPYYLFQCRPVVGSLALQIPLTEGVKIFSESMRHLTGIHKPRYAMSTESGKMEILGEKPNNKDEIMLRFHSAKNPENTGEVVFYNIKENNPYWYEL